MTACDVHMNRGNDLSVVRYLLHKSATAKENVCVCIETTAHGFVLA